MKALLIAEKPSMMRDIQKAYNKNPISDNLDFACFRGHVVELLEPQEYDKKYEKWNRVDLPIIPSQFKRKTSKGYFDLVKKLDDLLKNGGYDYVINACDAGREGELIFWGFYKSKGYKLPVKRFWANNLTETAIIKALNNLIDEHDPALVGLGKAAEYRAQFDWLCGMNFSRSVSIASNTPVAVGRVMSPVLKMIVDRENAILNFVPEDYYQVQCTLQAKGMEFSGMWMAPPEYEDRVWDRSLAEAALSKFADSATVMESVKTQQTVSAPTLHSLSELQKEANKEFGYAIDKTLEIAQKLYEERKLLTYPRTSSRYLPKEMVPEIKDHLKQVRHIPELEKAYRSVTASHIDKVLSTKDYVDDGKITDHHAILVTTETPDLSILSKDERNIYFLVARRFLSIFLPPYVAANTVLKMKSGKNWIKATGKQVLQVGYTELYSIKRKELFLPDLGKGDTAEITKKEILEKKTNPPKRYNDASIIDAMVGAGNTVDVKELRKVLKETEGIGTEATRTEIIKKLLSKGYIDRNKSYFVPLPLGSKIIDTIGSRDVCSPALTAIWEKKLGMVSEGVMKGDFKSEMEEYVTKETIAILSEVKADLSTRPIAEVVGSCPLCGSDILIGKNFYYCKAYKTACTLVIPKVFFGASISKTDVKALLSGKSTRDKRLTFDGGRTAIKSLILKKGKLTWESSDSKPAGICPACGSKLLQSEKGVFCTKPDCNFLFSKDQGDVVLTAEDAITLYKEGRLKDFKMTREDGSVAIGDITYKNGKIGLSGSFSAQKVGVCPLCGADVMAHKKTYACANENCEFSIGKRIKSAEISLGDVKTLLDGHSLESRQFFCRDNKWHEGSLSMENGELKFFWKKGKAIQKN